MRTRVIVISLSIIVLLSGCKKQVSTTDHPALAGFTLSQPEWIHRAVVYEVNIRQYSPEGTFAAFERQLPRLKTLGVDVLWLMPIHPISVKNRKGTLGSYYSVKDYYTVNPEFGTMDDFDRLVKSAHALGMKVILDWVANHTGWDNTLITGHPEWYTQRDGVIQPPNPDWHDVADLNYSNPTLVSYMVDAMSFWVREKGVDGFRCDTAEMLPADFWKVVRYELQKNRPVFMLAEGESGEDLEKSFDAVYAWHFMKLAQQAATNGSAEFIANYVTSIHGDARDPFHRLYFTSNHDENSWHGSEFDRYGSNWKTFAVMSFLLPGMPLIYSGQEAMQPKQLEFFEKDSISWRASEMENIYARMAELKHTEPALDARAACRIIPTKYTHNIAFTRESGSSVVLAAHNLSGKTVHLKPFTYIPSGSYHDAFSGANVDTRGSLTVPAHGYRVLLKQ